MNSSGLVVARRPRYASRFSLTAARVQRLPVVEPDAGPQLDGPDRVRGVVANRLRQVRRVSDGAVGLVCRNGQGVIDRGHHLDAA